MPRLKNLWQTLERLPGQMASRREWRERLREDFSLAERLLIPTDRFAVEVSDTENPYANYRVVSHADDDIVGINDADGSKIRLSKNEILIYRVDQKRLARLIAEAFGFQLVTGSFDRTSATRIGTLQSPSGLAYPVFLVIPLCPEDLRTSLERVNAQHDEPFILLAPTRQYMCPRCEALGAERAACLLPLDLSIEIDKAGRWIASSSGKQCLQTFQLNCDSRIARLRPRGAEDPKPSNSLQTSQSGSKGKPGKKDQPAELRSWTQSDLNAAIIEYKAKRASSYSELVAGVRAGLQGAKKSASKTYGRNALARELGVKAPAMVTKSPEWQAIADELQLSRGKTRFGTKARKVGLDIAMETHAGKNSTPASVVVERRETIRAIQEALPPAVATDLIEKLQRGETTYEDAQTIVQFAKDQNRDDKSWKVRGKP